MIKPEPGQLEELTIKDRIKIVKINSDKLQNICKMDAINAANAVISSVKKSNLNYYIQESPFSLYINLRKSFIKNKSSNVVLCHVPSSDSTDNTNEHEIKVEKLEQDKTYLNNYVEELKTELIETRDALKELSDELKKTKAENLDAVSKAHEANRKLEIIENSNKAVNKKNDDLQVMVDNLKSEKSTSNRNMDSKVKEVEKLKIENNNLENENIKLKEKLVLKDDEVRNAMDEKVGLQEKLDSLLDLLYGCNACGLCECECSDSVMEDCDSSPPPQYVTSDEQFSPPDTPSLTPPAPQNLPQPSSSPWTPPPTPPCSNCGGVNFGPCPSSVCFGCIPPLEDKLEPNTDSPSRTPPGTPPQLSKKQVSKDILGE